MGHFKFSLKHWLVLTFLVNLLFRIINITYGSYFLDEAANLWYFQQDFGTVIDRGLNDPNPPAYGIFIWGWIKAFGVTEFSTRLFSVICLAIGGALLFLFANKYFSLKTAIIAGIFFLFSDYLFYYSHAARPYSLLCLEIIISYFLLYKYTQRKSALTLISYLIINVLLLYSHPTTVFNLMAQGLFLFVFIKKDMKMVFTLWASILLAILSYYIWYSISPFFERPKHTWLDPPSWNTINFTIHRLLNGWWLLILAVIVGLISLVNWLRTKVGFDEKSKLTLLITFWAFLPLIFNICFSIFAGVSIFSAQYIITILPGFYFLLAILIVKLSEQKKMLAWIISIPIAFLMMFTINYHSTFREGWRDAVEFAKENQTESTAIFVDPQFQNRSFAFYYERSFYEDYNNTFRLLDSCNVFLATTTPIESLTESKFNKIIIVLSTNSPDKNLNVEKLRKEYKLIDKKGFGSVHVRVFDID